MKSHWSSTYEDQIAEELSHANHSIRIFAPDQLPDRLIGHFQGFLERGVSLELVIRSKDGEADINPFYLYKVLGLANNGACLYSSDNVLASDAFCFQIDFEEWVCFDQYNGKLKRQRKKQSEALELTAKMDAIINTTEEFRTDPDDIVISFSASSPMSLKGATTAIMWKVDHASVVEVDALGQVAFTGQAEVVVHETKIVNLYAFNGKQRKIKSIQIRVVERPKIVYDVQFLNPSSNQYVSLPEDVGSGVFGVAKGYRVKVIWEAKHTEQLIIEPIGEVPLVGQYEFLPEEPIEFKFSARLQDAVEERRILVQTFPVSIYTDAIVSIDLSWLDDKVLILNDAQSSLNEFLEHNQDKMQEIEQALKIQTASMEESIRHRFEELNFDGFYKDHSIAKVNITISERIKNYFRNEPTILELIMSMKTYYD